MVMAALVRLFFEPEGHDLLAAGMTLDLNGGSAMQRFLSFGVLHCGWACIAHGVHVQGLWWTDALHAVPEHLQREDGS